jgi:hypothetical protein
MLNGQDIFLYFRNMTLKRQHFYPLIWNSFGNIPYLFHTFNERNYAANLMQVRYKSQAMMAVIVRTQGVSV